MNIFKKFGRTILFLISVFLLVSVIGTADLKTVLADADCPSDENGVSLGCANPGSEGGWHFPEPEPEPQPIYTSPAPAPVTPPAASCPTSDDSYTQCGGTTGLENYPATDTIKVTRSTDCNGNVVGYHNDNLGNLGQCQSAQCPRIDVVRTEQDCVGDQWCTFNVWQGPNADGSCKYDRGGAYGCQRINGRCGATTPEVIRTPQPPAPVAQLPVPIGQPIIIPVQIPVAQPVYTYPTPAQVPQCTRVTRQEYTCFNTQLCRFDEIRNSNCSISRQGPYDCRPAIECGFRPTPVYPTPPIIPVQPPVILPPAPVAPAPVVRVASAECPAGTINRGVRGSEIICETPATATQPVRVVQVASIQAKEMPKTGLPLLAWAALAFVPAGFKMKKVGKVQENISANYLFEDREFKRS